LAVSQEVTTGLLPYAHLPHDGIVIPAIIRGETPQIGDLQTRCDPDWLTRIMKGCWDLTPKKRPLAAAVAKSIQVVLSRQIGAAAEMIANGELNRALMIASLSRDSLEIRSTILLGANVNALLTSEDVRAIADAVEEASLETASLLKPGYGALHLACAMGAVDIVGLLVSQGANPVISPTISFNEWRENEKTVKLPTMLPLPVDWTPLQVACMTGQYDTVKFLVEHNAALNILTEKAGPPIEIAKHHGHSEIVKYLAENGAITHSALVDLLIHFPESMGNKSVRFIHLAALFLFVIFFLLMGGLVAGMTTKESIFTQRSFRIAAAAMSMLVWTDWAVDTLAYYWGILAHIPFGRWWSSLIPPFVAASIFLGQQHNGLPGFLAPATIILGLAALWLRGISFIRFLNLDAYHPKWYRSKWRLLKFVRAFFAIGAWIVYIVSSKESNLRTQRIENHIDFANRLGCLQEEIAMSRVTAYWS
jgi:ankyrin repeat protein